MAFSIAVTGASLGISASRFLSLRYYSPPPAPGRDKTAPPAPSQALSPERWTNIFAPSAGMALPSRLAGKSAENAPPPVTYILLGTIASDPGSRARAILWTEGMKEPRIVREGDSLDPGVRLASIGRGYVVLLRGKKRERLELLPVGSKGRPVPLPAGAPAASAPGRVQAQQQAADAGPAVQVSKLGENHYSLDESSVTQLTANINQYMTQVRLIPYFEGNKSSGYRIAAIRPGSAFDQLGFKGGDIIQQVNEVDLSSPEKVYTIFQNMKDEKRVTVNIIRQGAKNTLTYEIR